MGYNSKQAVTSALSSVNEELKLLGEKETRLTNALTAMDGVLSDWILPASINLCTWNESINAFGDFSWEGEKMSITKNHANYFTGNFSTYYYSYEKVFCRNHEAVYLEKENTSTRISELEAERDNLRNILVSWERNHPKD